jgi:hypothetical protein
MTWFLVYIALVPIFATAYASLPQGGLHDSNTEIERPLASDARRLEASLTAATNARIKQPAWVGDDTILRLLPYTLQVAAIRHTNNGQLLLEFEGLFVGERTRHTPGVRGNFQEWVQVSLDSRLITQLPGRSPQIGYSVNLTSPEGGATEASLGSPPVSTILPPPSASLPVSPSDFGFVVVPPVANDMLTRFDKAAEGDPLYESGAWLRMLYFSATTITTLGLGDITPVSNPARLLVGFESLLGIIVIGLFLNALALGLRRARPVPAAASSGVEK